MQDNLELFQAEGIKVYGISYDTSEQLLAFASDYDVTYDLLAQQERQ